MNKDTNKPTRAASNEGGSFAMQMDNTTYTISIHFSKTSKETLEDKVKRLIQRDVKDGNF